MRTIKQVINSYIKAVDTSLPITSPLPNQTIKQISPFIMLEHQGPNTIMPNQKIKLSNQNNFGVSRLSLLLEGSIEYEDSLKNKGILNAGDIQWLNDTSGIIRTEKVFESNIKDEIKFHLIQIWIAYPDDFLFRPLKYQDIKKENISEVNGDGFKLRLIKDENVEIADISNPNLNTQKIIHGIIEAGKFVNIDIPNNFNACLYIIDGEIKIMGENIESRKLVWFNNDGENIRINAISNSQFLLLSGESLEKTLAQYYSEITN